MITPHTCASCRYCEPDPDQAGLGTCTWLERRLPPLADRPRWVRTHDRYAVSLKRGTDCPAWVSAASGIGPGSAP